MSGSGIEVRPYAGALGAVVSGVDLAQPLDDATLAALRRVWLAHLVLFFRDQRLAPAQLKAFAAHFGPLNRHPILAGVAGEPTVLELRREPDARYCFSDWHTNLTYMERPLLGAMLYAREVPAAGGDTQFANMYLAYETLSDGMKALLGGLVAVHAANVAAYLGDPTRKASEAEMAARVAEHPVVRTHPETGRKSLFVHAVSTTHFKGMTVAESRPLLSYLFRHALRPEFTCRFDWAVDSLAFWDNRCTQHQALDDYFGQRRVMHRVSIEGDRPA